jgi:hypothetical protein
MPQILTREGPADGEVQIIGVELAVTQPEGGEVELDMFPCRHTLPQVSQYGWNRQIRITLHTSHGDITLREFTNRL